MLSNFNFCPLSWHFCSEGNTKKIEKVQERALRFVYDDFVSTYEELLEPELSERQHSSPAATICKYCIQEKFCPRFIFALFSEGEFKTG